MSSSTADPRTSGALESGTLAIVSCSYPRQFSMVIAGSPASLSKPAIESGSIFKHFQQPIYLQYQQPSLWRSRQQRYPDIPHLHLSFRCRKLRQILQLQSNICSAPANPRVLCEKFTSLTSDIKMWIDMNLSGHLKSEFWNRLHARE
ncbi:hypothetical protein PGT21_008299 [Puccinia graminis f. sp. tritici]|uniref:Uncharacterized protein n=1 Tax=Puccinia graminis f. sp. tritici TaxID=56615 RepID=A0A5B0P8T8_PUCGR|nr:hypothetical protein PGT21_008299 [Puccinia graminis f. sp. tritici]KAA1134158.1 hypothetical protein PGTUg99_030389 [Puccinia graminis f. sp. tritici]